MATFVKDTDIIDGTATEIEPTPIRPLGSEEPATAPVAEWDDERFGDRDSLPDTSGRMIVIRVVGDQIYARSYGATGAQPLVDLLTVAGMMGATVAGNHDEMQSRLTAMVQTAIGQTPRP